MQGTLVSHASDYKTKCTIFNESVITPESSSYPCPHWMSPKNEEEFQVRSSVTSVLGSRRAIVRPQCLKETLHSRSQECMKPSLFLSTDTEVKQLNDLGIALQLRARAFNSEHSLQKLVPSTSLSLKPLEAPSREEQRDSRVDLLSLLFKKQQKQLVEGGIEALPGLATSRHGQSGFNKKSDATSWVSKFPFQIGPDMDFGQSIEFEMSALQRQSLHHNEGLVSMRTCASHPAGTKKHIDKSNFLIQHLSSPPRAVQSGLIQESADSTTSKCAVTALGSGMPYLKHDWNLASMQCVQFPQTLPDFFAHQKVMTAAKVNIFGNPERDLDIHRNGISPHKDFFARLGGETAERNGNSTGTHRRMMGQQVLACATLAEENFCHSLCTKINAPTVNIHALTVAYEASQSDQLASMEALHTNCETHVSGGKCSLPAFRAVSRRQVSCVDLDVSKPVYDVQATEFVPAKKCTSTTDMPGDSLQALATVSICAEKSHTFEGLEKARTDPEGDWSQFVASSKMREVTDSHLKILLPFEQRFKQLQQFLKKCDHSDVQYCQQASQMLSASAQGNHAVELESRALKLSMEEGKEIKRAKLLNMLDEGPEWPFLAVYRSSMGPYSMSSHTEGNSLKQLQYSHDYV